ncbi:MAG: Signal peptidase-like protein [Cytophagales bacterium]|nr:MAG: Signal peptidase-like protein [Cytophagales bacterium]TAF59505.1 MAG: Signal peptidase-like protein [Cytophagales bacterium]
MACNTCSTKSAEGSSAGGCSSTGGCGCNKKNSYDWLSEMDIPAPQFPIVEVRFKGGRKEFFRNPENLDLTTGDFLVLEASKGYHIGALTLQGELVRLQMRKKNVSSASDTLLNVIRVATVRDMQKFEQSRNRELPTLYRTREIINTMGLKMKLSDVEYQADNTKATFYYSANTRIDFRELIKELASEFRIRVEMRQINMREEAGRLGGIGACGRELCCSTWISGFKNVATSAARYQNLALNPAKLSGQCGRLKCCLNYELDTYMTALRDIPKVDTLQTEKGILTHRKTDIFKQVLWFSYPNEEAWYPLTITQVSEYVSINKKGQKAPAPQAEAVKHTHHLEQPISFELDLSELEDEPSEKSSQHSDKQDRNAHKNRKDNKQRRHEGHTKDDKKPALSHTNLSKSGQPFHKNKSLKPSEEVTEKKLKPVSDSRPNFKNAPNTDNVKLPPRQKAPEKTAEGAIDKRHQKPIQPQEQRTNKPQTRNDHFVPKDSSKSVPKTPLPINPKLENIKPKPTSDTPKFKKPHHKKPFNRPHKNKPEE